MLLDDAYRCALLTCSGVGSSKSGCSTTHWHGCASVYPSARNRTANPEPKQWGQPWRARGADVVGGIWAAALRISIAVGRSGSASTIRRACSSPRDQRESTAAKSWRSESVRASRVFNRRAQVDLVGFMPSSYTLGCNCRPKRGNAILKGQRRRSVSVTGSWSRKLTRVSSGITAAFHGLTASPRTCRHTMPLFSRRAQSCSMPLRLHEFNVLLVNQLAPRTGETTSPRLSAAGTNPRTSALCLKEPANGARTLAWATTPPALITL